MRALLALVLLAATAHADVANEASLGTFSRALRSDSANALTDESLVGPTFGYARRLPVHLAPRLELWATAHVLFAVARGTMFQTLDTELSMFQPSAGVRAVYPLWRRYAIANARFELGAQRVRVELEDAHGHNASDVGWGMTSTAALGVELMPLALDRFELGMRIELGYVATTGVGLTAKSDGPADDMIELDRMAASLGRLEIGGRFVSVTLTAQF